MRRVVTILVVCSLMKAQTVPQTSGQGHPLGIAPKSVLFYGAKCDWNGSTGTDDLQALTMAVSNGGTVVIPSGSLCYSSDSVVFSSSVHLMGMGMPSGATASGLVFAAGKTGVVIGDGSSGGSATARLSRISNLAISSLSTTSGNDNGVQVQALGVTLENVAVSGFGRDCFEVDSTKGTSTNNNSSRFIHLIAQSCRNHGIYVNGGDSQVVTFELPYTAHNGAYGIYMNSGGHHIFLSPLSEYNTTGGYYDNSGTSLWLWPYSEGDGEPNAVIGPTGQYQWWQMGNYGAPSLVNNGGSTNLVWRNGSFQGPLNVDSDVNVGRYLSLFNRAQGGSTVFNLQEGSGNGGNPMWNIMRNDGASIGTMLFSGGVLYFRLGGTGGTGNMSSAVFSSGGHDGVSVSCADPTPVAKCTRMDGGICTAAICSAGWTP